MKRLKKLLMLIIIHVFNCLPIKKNKIFMFSYYGSQYGCNPKYLTEYILKHTPVGKFDIVWAFNDPDSQSINRQIRKVKVMSSRYFYELCTSKVIITNFRTTDLFIKRKQQYYIQTWHSSLRLKQIEKDAEEVLPEHYLKMAQRDSKKCNLVLSGCDYSTQIFKRSFWYEGEIFELGTPRNDIFFQNEKRKDLLGKLNIPEETKIVLYAPTFRKNNDLNAYDLDYSKVTNNLKNRFGGNWIVLIKFHPHLISVKRELPADQGLVDVTNYDDIQELLNISDVLITDYSSLMFDFSITKRPCFLYVPDIEDYTAQDRKLYFELNDLPFIQAKSNQDLTEKIIDFQAEVYERELKYFLDRIGTFENGQASEQIIQRINEVCFTEKRREVYETI
ncbi:CDP-glycerol glycerophosphotransferase family protein [Halobacillus amylolyticus]|uniref:CDP-glycerol glycerophosphotransferase family protein n=1 Tax=Halobacillus amylolyticus TaxID=2932259 RepID=A0ABY4HG78_9BACI|nr:CDP-glycerol glycerophosphotransferase family protein [Halobacillus amylolyticus]UOR13791.1 CDP-glycerol glycerophosphotransferase family protein [Halobacillus amylolyticus]